MAHIEEKNDEVEELMRRKADLIIQKKDLMDYVKVCEDKVKEMTQSKNKVNGTTSQKGTKK